MEKQKLRVGDYVRARRTFSDDWVKGTFMGFYLTDTGDPDSDVGVVEVINAGGAHYYWDVYPNSIEPWEVGKELGMTQEDKQLLLKVLCTMLPYEIRVQYEGKEWLVTGYGHGRVSLLPGIFSSASGPCPLVEEVRPYLRPMSSMTEEERNRLKAETCPNGTGYFNEKYLVCPVNHFGEHISFGFMSDIIDWLNKHHFDFRGLIEKGLALEAPEGMYKTE